MKRFLMLVALGASAIALTPPDFAFGRTRVIVRHRGARVIVQQTPVVVQAPVVVHSPAAVVAPAGTFFAPAGACGSGVF